MKPLEESIPFFIAQNMRTDLDTIYSEVPSGSCDGSTHCCCESVNCFYSEYLNIVKELQNKGTYEEFSKKAIRYWLCELSLPMKCPILKEDGLCEVYEARPLPCRVFGHLNRVDFESNIEAIRDQNCSAAEDLREQFGIVVPDSVVSGQVGFCANFRSETGMSSDDRDDLIDRLFGVESKFLGEEFLDFDEFNLSLTQWFAYEHFGRENAMALRIKIAQEFTELGHSKSLDIWEASE